MRSFGVARDLCAAASRRWRLRMGASASQSFRELDAKGLFAANASRRARTCGTARFSPAAQRYRRAVQLPDPRPPWPHQLSRRHLPRRQIRDTRGSRTRLRALRCGPHGRSAGILGTRPAHAARSCCRGRAVLDYPSLSRGDMIETKLATRCGSPESRRMHQARVAERHRERSRSSPRRSDAQAESGSVASSGRLSWIDPSGDPASGVAEVGSTQALGNRPATGTVQSRCRTSPICVIALAPVARRRACPVPRRSRGGSGGCSSPRSRCSIGCTPTSGTTPRRSPTAARARPSPCSPRRRSRCSGASRSWARSSRSRRSCCTGASARRGAGSKGGPTRRASRLALRRRAHRRRAGAQRRGV